MPLSAEEQFRYSRHICLPQIGEAGQRRLREARVLLVGIGGLGSPAALYLAAAGVGTLGLAEFDIVALHNLQRQVLFREADVGAPKIAAALAHLHALDSRVHLIVHEKGLTPENATALFSQYDVVLDGTDNFPARYLANDAAFFACKPLVHGSIFQFAGQVSVFDRASGNACYRCLFPEMPDPESIPTCEQAGVFGALCGVVGSFMAMEAVKLATGVGVPLRGRLLMLDLLAATSRTVRLLKDAACPLCGSSPRIMGIDAGNYSFHNSCCAPCCLAATSGEEAANVFPLEISSEEARVWLARAVDVPLVLDVREGAERAAGHLPGSLHIPLNELAGRIHELPAHAIVIVYCQHGQRSLRAARMLRARGYAYTTSLSGGLARWAN
ncbi:MAG: molybdopterin-synthase adenylyltransferase MoeB [Puniceicoccales bacterium]|jgi:adenylyltransferase/sulfurtransferase|nr:molybdopterin-synthase adenylyltransferase MoeB [Puniceicoccales bacterium]